MMTTTYDPHFPRCHNCGRTLPVSDPLGYCSDCYRAYLRGRASLVTDICYGNCACGCSHTFDATAKAAIGYWMREAQRWESAYHREAEAIRADERENVLRRILNGPKQDHFDGPMRHVCYTPDAVWNATVGAAARGGEQE